MGDQSKVRSFLSSDFSPVVWFDFRRPIGSWRLESGHCKQRNWSQVLPVCCFFFKSEASVSAAAGLRGRWDHRSQSLYLTTKKTRDNPNTNDIWTRTHSSPKNATDTHLLMETKSPTVLRNLPALLNTSFFFQTSDEPVELRFSGRQEFEVLRVDGRVHSSSKTDLMSADLSQTSAVNAACNKVSFFKHTHTHKHTTLQSYQNI